MEKIVKKITIHPESWLYLLLFIALGFFLWKAWQMIILILAAVVLAIFIESMATYLTKIKIPRSVAIIIVFVISVAGIGYLLYQLVPVFITELANLKKILPGAESIQKLADAVTGGKGETLAQVDPKVFINRIQGSIGSLSSGFAGFLGSLFGNIINVVLLMVLSLYLALEEGAIERLLRSVIPVTKEEYAVSLWLRVKSKVESWFRGQLIIALITAVSIFVGLTIMQIPNTLLLGLVAGIFGMVPFGIAVAALPAAMLAFFHGGVLSGLYVLLLYWLLNQILDYFVGPYIVKKTTGLPSLVIIISLVLSVTLLGILGFFLSIPFAILLLELVSDIEQKKILGSVIKEDALFIPNEDVGTLKGEDLLEK